MTNKTEKPVEIKKMIVTISDRDITLTMDEAEKLHAALSKLFGDKTVVKHEYHQTPYWAWRHNQPTVTWLDSSTGSTSMEYRPRSGEIMCSLSAAKKDEER